MAPPARPSEYALAGDLISRIDNSRQFRLDPYVVAGEPCRSTRHRAAVAAEATRATMAAEVATEAATATKTRNPTDVGGGFGRGSSGHQHT